MVHSYVVRNAKEKHTCALPTLYCICSRTWPEPHLKCPIHGSGEWPPRCQYCGKFVKWDLLKIRDVEQRLDRW